jgi:hypothetical protein
MPGRIAGFVAESGWKNITWSSQTKGTLGRRTRNSVSGTQPDTVSVTLSNVEGCKIIRKTAVKDQQA